MTTNRPDPYAILGITWNATQTEISHAYRVLLHQHHPDTRPPGTQSQDAASDETLQRVVAAYHILGDPDRRAAYDRAAPPRVHWRRQQTQHATNPVRSYSQPPIIAGPVRWYPTLPPPSE